MKLTLIITFVLIFTSGLFSQDEYTLESCETDISENVPEFFQKYFHCVTARMSESGNYVNLYFNGTAPYESWYWIDWHPNHIEWYSQGEGYFLIPNAYIEEFDYVISIPVNPEPRSDLSIDGSAVDGEVGTSNFEYPMGSVGAALNGVNMFNPCASTPDIIEDELYSFDLYKGHPAGPSGIYHYHTNSPGPLEVLNYKMPDVVTNTEPGEGEIEVFGIMCDGTVVLGCTELNGSAPNSSNWDAQNGHVHDLMDEEGVVQLENRYHTHICYDELTENDTDGNGYQEHEFTPEISYYAVPGMGDAFDRCWTSEEPIEPDMEMDVKSTFVPAGFYLYQNYPNPFNAQTTILYDLPTIANVNISIYDLQGRFIEEIVSEFQTAGMKSVVWNAMEFASGIYVCKITAGEFSESRKMVLLK